MDEWVTLSDARAMLDDVDNGVRREDVGYVYGVNDARIGCENASTQKSEDCGCVRVHEDARGCARDG